MEAATRTTKSALSGATRALATFGLLTTFEACPRETPNLGEARDHRGLPYERLGLFNDYDLSKPQGYHRAKLPLPGSADI